jgi:hypothetical protein
MLGHLKPEPLVVMAERLLAATELHGRHSHLYEVEELARGLLLGEEEEKQV